MSRQPYATQCERGYTRTGKTAHLLPPLASLPLCKRCEGHARAADEAGRRIAGLGRQERAS